MKCPASRSRRAAAGILVGSIALLLTTRNTDAQGGSSVSYSTAGSQYTQDFSGLPTTGSPSSNTGIFAFGDPTINATNMAGWYGEAASKNVYLSGTGVATTGAFYDFANTTTPSDQALGLQTTTTSGDSIFGLELVNTTGTTLTSFNIDYNAELWHYGNTTTAKILEFGYVVGGGSTLPTISATGTITPASGTYVHYAALDFTKAAPNTTSAGAVDGHATGNNSDENATISGISWQSGTSLWLTWDFSTNAAQTPGLAIDNLTFSALGGGVVAANVVWHPSNGVGVWDTVTGNWTGGAPTANLFKTGDNATFDDTHPGTAGGTVTIQAGGVNPGSTTVNTAGTYTFQNSGADANGITGTGNLTKTGAGTLILSSPNTYTGGTIVNGGILKFSNDNQLGAASGPLSLDNSTLSITANIPAMNRSLTIGVDGATIVTNGNTFTNNGATAINGALTQSGGGAISFNGPVTLGAAVTLSIPVETTLTFGQTTGVVTFGNGALINGTLNIGVAGSATGARINFDSPNSTSPGVTGSGTINVLSSSTLMTNLSGTTGDTVSVKIALNSSDPTGASFTKGDVTQATYVPGSFVTTIGGTTAQFGLTVNSVISGASDVNFANAQTGGGSGQLVLGGQSTYTGTTTFNPKNGSVLLAVDNALPVGTSMIYGTQGANANGASFLDLGGHNQQFGSLSTVSPLPTGGTFTIQNGATGSFSTLTVSGSTTPANTFAGVINEGIGQIALVKNGTNTLDLAGANTYTGGTTVKGGTLIVDGSISGNTTVQTGGKLGGIGTIGTIGSNDSLEVMSGGKLAPGLTPSTTVVGTLTANGFTWDGGGSLLLALSKTDNTSDKLSLGTGVLTKGSAGTFQFDFLGGGLAGQTYQLMTFGSHDAAFSSASFSSTDLVSGLGGNFTLTNSELDFTTVVVPEPSALAGLFWGAGVLLGARRFRRRAGL